MGQRERLEEKIAQLKETLDRCFEKRLLTDDPEKEVKLDALEKKLETQLKEKERELNQLLGTAANKNRVALDLDEGLCNIDFDAAKAQIESSLRSLEEQGGSALFLMERCLDMEGHLLLKSMRDLLRARTQQLIEYRVAFIPTMPANELTFLRLLGGHLGLSFEDDIEVNLEQRLPEITDQVIQEMTSLLRSGTTVLIPLINWRKLGVESQVSFLDWLMRVFWQRMTMAVNVVMQDYSPKVFFVIMVDGEMAEDCQKQDYFGTGEAKGEDLDSKKIMRLPLECWTPSDVSRWLGSYSTNLKKPERQDLIKFIFSGKEEAFPRQIRAQLENPDVQSCL